MAQMSIWGSGPFSWLQPCPSCHAILARWTTSKAQRSWRSCRHLAKMDVDHRSTETGPWSWKQDSFVINLNDPFNEVGEVLPSVRSGWRLACFDKFLHGKRHEAAAVQHATSTQLLNVDWEGLKVLADSNTVYGATLPSLWRAGALGTFSLGMCFFTLSPGLLSAGSAGLLRQIPLPRKDSTAFGSSVVAAAALAAAASAAFLLWCRFGGRCRAKSFFSFFFFSFFFFPESCKPPPDTCRPDCLQSSGMKASRHKTTMSLDTWKAASWTAAGGQTCDHAALKSGKNGEKGIRAPCQS